MSENILKRAGDVVLNQIIIVSPSTGVIHNITPQAVMLQIYESVNDVFLRGDILVRDGQAITNVFPLVGNEIVDITFKTPGSDDEVIFNKRFVITGCSEKFKKNRESVYALYLTSSAGVLDCNATLSKRFSGQVSEVAKQLIEYYDTKSEHQSVKLQPNIEPTTNNCTFISNWWHPSRCLKYICDRAVDSKGYPAFVFYENKMGLNFVSLNSIFDLLKDTPLQQFVWDDSKDQAAENIDSTMVKVPLSEYSKILQMPRIMSGFDYYQRIQSGYYGGEVISFDPTFGRYVHCVDTGNRKAPTTINKYSVMTDVRLGATSGHMAYVPSNSYLYDHQVDNTDLKQYLPRRTFLARLDNSHKMAIEVHGHSNYTVGQVVNVMIPKDQQILKDEDPYDRLISGNYFVYELKHTIEIGAYCTHTCVMNLVKDSYIIDPNQTAIQ